jgi:cytochrome c oxidase subunit 2
MWFTPTMAGRYHLFCAEYCGTDHSRMRGAVVVMEPADFERWLAGQGGAGDVVKSGETLFRTLGCSGCHEQRSVVRAPSLAGIYGRPVPLANGNAVIADERYLRDSILLPRKEVAAGYEPIMPSFAGQLDEEDILDLIAYIKSLANEREQPK